MTEDDTGTAMLFDFINLSIARKKEEEDYHG